MTADYQELIDSLTSLVNGKSDQAEIIITGQPIGSDLYTTPPLALYNQEKTYTAAEIREYIETFQKYMDGTLDKTNTTHQEMEAAAFFFSDVLSNAKSNGPSSTVDLVFFVNDVGGSNNFEEVNSRIRASEFRDIQTNWNSVNLAYENGAPIPAPPGTVVQNDGPTFGGPEAVPTSEVEPTNNTTQEVIGSTSFDLETTTIPITVSTQAAGEEIPTSDSKVNITLINNGTSSISIPITGEADYIKIYEALTEAGVAGVIGMVPPSEGNVGQLYFVLNDQNHIEDTLAAVDTIIQEGLITVAGQAQEQSGPLQEKNAPEAPIGPQDRRAAGSKQYTM